MTDVESNDAISIVTLSDWRRDFVPVYETMRSKTKINRTLYARFFPRFEQLTGIY